MRVTGINIRRLEGVAFHLVCSIGSSHFIHTDRNFAVADPDAAGGLTQPIHQDQDLLLARQRHLGVGVNIVHRWRLRQAGQEGGLRQRELVGRLAKIRLCCGFDAVGEIAVIDFVKIKLKDVVFGIAAGNFGCKNDLAHFT